MHSVLRLSYRVAASEDIKSFADEFCPEGSWIEVFFVMSQTGGEML
jgi:hypothetical protein